MGNGAGGIASATGGGGVASRLQEARGDLDCKPQAVISIVRRRSLRDLDGTGGVQWYRRCSYIYCESHRRRRRRSLKEGRIVQPAFLIKTKTTSCNAYY